MSLVFADLDAERVSVELTYRGQTFQIHVNPNDLTEALGAEIQAAIHALEADAPALADGDTTDAPAPSKYDPLLVRVVREWEIAATRADAADGRYWPVDLAHAARLPLSCKRLMFWLMIGKLFSPDPEPLAASSSAGSGGLPSTTPPATDGPPSGTRSRKRATAGSTPAN